MKRMCSAPVEITGGEPCFTASLSFADGLSMHHAGAGCMLHRRRALHTSAAAGNGDATGTAWLLILLASFVHASDLCIAVHMLSGMPLVATLLSTCMRTISTPLLLTCPAANCPAGTSTAPLNTSAASSSTVMDSGDGRPRVCILGGGFGGLYTAIKLELLMWPRGKKPKASAGPHRTVHSLVLVMCL